MNEASRNRRVDSNKSSKSTNKQPVISILEIFPKSHVDSWITQDQPILNPRPQERHWGWAPGDLLHGSRRSYSQELLPRKGEVPDLEMYPGAFNSSCSIVLMLLLLLPSVQRREEGFHDCSSPPRPDGHWPCAAPPLVHGVSGGLQVRKEWWGSWRSFLTCFL